MSSGQHPIIMFDHANAATAERRRHQRDRAQSAAGRSLRAGRRAR